MSIASLTQNHYNTARVFPIAVGITGLVSAVALAYFGGLPITTIALGTASSVIIGAVLIERNGSLDKYAAIPLIALTFGFMFDAAVMRP